MSLRSRLIRLEPLALLLPAEHPLAAEEAVPVAALWGTEVDVNIANPDAPEWSDLSRQFLRAVRRVPDASPPPRGRARGAGAPPHAPGRSHPDRGRPPAHPGRGGPAARRSSTDLPVVAALAGRPPEPDPGPVEIAAVALAETDDWLALPDGAWLPEPEASRGQPAALGGGSRSSALIARRAMSSSVHATSRSACSA